MSTPPVASGRWALIVMRVLCIALAAMSSTLAIAQASFPSRPITLIVPYPPGGSNDILARAIAARLSERIGQPVVVDNRAGAGGIIGSRVLASAAPDGYTLGYVSISFTTSAAIQPKMPFDVIKDFAPVALTGTGPMLIVARNDLPAKSLAEFIVLAKAKPGSLTYASSGPGSVNQLAAEQFANSVGVKLTHIPYKGMGPATVDLIGGRVDIIFSSIPSVIGFVRSGQMRALAVTSDGATPLAPNIAAANANGATGYTFLQWSGMLSPAGTPPAVVARLNSEINQILSTPEMQAFLLREGLVAASQTPAQFAALIASDLARWKALAAELGLKPE